MYTTRKINCVIADVWAAFADADRLARWWGPEGFSNTFEVCEFESGGRWIYTMHGPDGKDYPNESVFREVIPEQKVVIDHVSLPIYELTISLQEENGVTLVKWEQEFENQVFATKMRDFLETANGQNLDRLTAEVAHLDHQT
ncbi:MAG TPA: SRPBCC domain-containing protein [Pyrinomonadaceae bacterium]|nr:SRPBCC domain-containing protein [Pyrinomonadaceae bacterium]